jgi:ribonuclease HI
LIEAYTDGSIRENPGGPGGWAFVVVRDEDAREQVSGGSPSTTNNIMEMTAVIEAILFLKDEPKFTIVCDSQYVVKGVNDYMHSWARKNWPLKVKNRELWQLMHSLFDPNRMTIEWVRGHSGNAFNEIADYLAGKEMRRYYGE